MPAMQLLILSLIISCFGKNLTSFRRTLCIGNTFASLREDEFSEANTHPNPEAI